MIMYHSYVLVGGTYWILKVNGLLEHKPATGLPSAIAHCIVIILSIKFL